MLGIWRIAMMEQNIHIDTEQNGTAAAIETGP